jgi:alpha/beta superfamily hydrolase
MASVDNKIVEIFIPGPAGRLEAKYFKSKKNTSPIALVLHPHPQYGGTMNNKIVVDIFQTFVDNDFSVCRVNFRGVGKSDGEFDNGQGELADAAAALDWLERENFDNSQCWISGFSFGSLIAMQLLMRRPEINRFVVVSPQPNVYDFSFLSPCPTSGMHLEDLPLHPLSKCFSHPTVFTFSSTAINTSEIFISEACFDNT